MDRREKNEQINSKQKRAKRKKNFNNDKSLNTNTKIEGKKSITPRDNNPLMEMNKEHISEEDSEETINNKSREGIQQKGQKRKNSRKEQEKEADNQNKKRKEIRDTTNKIQNMKMKRKIENKYLMKSVNLTQIGIFKEIQESQHRK